MWHTISTQLTTDPDGPTTVKTVYNGEGLPYTVSNPERSESSYTDGTTIHYYDALERPIEIADQDGSLLQWCYDGVSSSPAVAYCSSSQLGGTNSGTRVDSTDEAGNKWQRISDGLGRLETVFEPNGTTQTPSTSMETNYKYDALNDLLSVNQYGSRGRSFTYDGLACLLTAQNPETGTVTYAYLTSGADCGVVTLP